MSFINDMKNLKLQGTLVSIYTDRDDMDRFSCGYIEDIDDEFVYINHVTSSGENDGIVVRKNAEILKIEYEGEYERRIERLYKLKEQEHKKYLNSNSNCKIRSLLSYAKDNGLIITVAIGDSDEYTETTGLIEKLQEGKIFISQISFYGESVGMSIIKEEDIYKINCDTQDEEDILLLLKDSK